MVEIATAGMIIAIEFQKKGCRPLQSVPVQALDGGTISTAPTISSKTYSKQFGNVTVLLDRISDQQPGNLYVRENNVLRRVGNPSYIYGVTYFKLGPFESYTPVDKLEMTDRWVYTVAINPAVTPLSSRNVRVNIDTNEVQPVYG